MAVTLSTRSSWASPQERVNGFSGDLVASVCALSSGVHAALVVPHFEESAALAVTMAVAAAALALAAVTQAVLDGPTATAAVAGLLLATAGAYLLSRTTGIPGLAVHPEPFDAVGVVISSLEVAAAAVAARTITTRSST